MKEYRHELKSEGLSGYVVLQVPSFKERMAVMKELGIKGADVEDPLALASTAYEKLTKMITEMNVTVGEQTFSEIDELSYYAEFQPFLAEMQEVLFNGISLGKKPSTQS